MAVLSNLLNILNVNNILLEYLEALLLLDNYIHQEDIHNNKTMHSSTLPLQFCTMNMIDLIEMAHLCWLDKRLDSSYTLFEIDIFIILQ
jgi:hypothetical protein